MASLLDLFGTDPSGLLTAEQQQGLQKRALLNAGLTMMANSVGQPGQDPRWLPAIAQSIGAGQQAYATGADEQVKGMLTAAKLAEMRRAQMMQALELRTLYPDAAGAPESPSGASMLSPAATAPLGAPAGPAGPAAAAGASGAPPAGTPMSDTKAKAERYRQAAQFAAMRGDSPAAANYMAMADRLDPAEKFGTSTQTMVGADGRPVAVQVGDQGTLRPVPGYTPQATVPGAVQAFRQIYGRDPTQADLPQLKQVAESLNSGTGTNVTVQADQKLFSNEMDLRKEFQGLPVVKAFGALAETKAKMDTLLADPSGVSDLGAATMFMKMLDPGSVVRESELAMAMQTTGLLDSMQNYYTKLKNGETLNPQQRAEFAAVTQRLFDAAQRAYSPVEQQYRRLAASYQFTPDRVAVAPVGVDTTVPPGQRRSLGDIFNRKVGP